MELLTLTEAATFLRIEENTLRYLVRDKKIEYSKPTGKLLFKRATLEKMVTDKTTNPITSTPVLSHG